MSFNPFNALVLSACLLLASCGGGSDESDTPAPTESATPPIPVFVFAGQSNMNGSDAAISLTTGVLDLVDMGLQTDMDRSALFTMATPSTSYPWGDIRGHNGYHYGRAFLDGKPVKVHGPEVGFNRTVGGNIAIVKYADNYQALEDGRSAWVKPGTRWTAWQAFVDQQLTSLGRPYKVVGVVWFQGIDDGLLNRPKEDYQADLIQLLADVRAKFGNVPVVVGRSVNSPIAGAAAMAPIRAAQVEVGSMPGNAWIDVDDLQIVADHHLSSAAQLTAGQRFGEAYLRLK